MLLAVASGFSKTALMVAGYRARATARAGSICRDPYAAALAGEEGLELSRNYDRVYPIGELYTSVRTAFIDGEVIAAIRRGMQRIVILGAGMDTRAARLGHEGVRFYEVDGAASQDEKLRRLRSIADYPIDAATYVSCDFEREDFVERLTEKGFSTAEPAFIVWEGVVCYLTEAAVRATLQRIANACEPSTMVLFDYFSKKLTEGRSKRADDEAMREWLEGLGEPLRFGINDVLPLLYEEGFRHVRTLSFDEACLTLTGTYDRERMFRFPRLALASAAPPETVRE